MKYGKLDNYTVFSSIKDIEIREDRLRLYTTGFGCGSSNRNAAFADYISRILFSLGAHDYTVDFNYTTTEEWYDYIDLGELVADKFYTMWRDDYNAAKQSSPNKSIEALATELRSFGLNVEITENDSDDDPDNDDDNDPDFDDVEGEDGEVIASAKLDPKVVAAMSISRRTLELLIRAAPSNKIRTWLETELESLNTDIAEVTKTGKLT